jgi:hypothetical protein
MLKGVKFIRVECRPNGSTVEPLVLLLRTIDRLLIILLNNTHDSVFGNNGLRPEDSLVHTTRRSLSNTQP